MATKMEVDSAASGVMASAGTTGSVSVSLHPLVIMNISEHWTRVRAQEGKATQGSFLILDFMQNRSRFFFCKSKLSQR